MAVFAALGSFLADAAEVASPYLALLLVRAAEVSWPVSKQEVRGIHIGSVKQSAVCRDSYTAEGALPPGRFGGA